MFQFSKGEIRKQKGRETTKAPRPQDRFNSRKKNHSEDTICGADSEEVMFDRIKMQKICTMNEIEQTFSRISNMSKTVVPSTGRIEYKGKIKNIRLCTKQDNSGNQWLHIDGSIPKFLSSSNLITAGLNDLKRFSREFLFLTGIDLSLFQLYYLEVSFTFEMDNHPANYINMMEHYPYGEKREFNDGNTSFGWIGTIFSLLFYDKIAELKKSKQRTSDYHHHQLRLEWTIWDDLRIIKPNLLFSDLLNERILELLLKKYRQRYKWIRGKKHYGGALRGELTEKINQASYN